MNTISKRVISIIPVQSGKITQWTPNVEKEPNQNIRETGPENYVLTAGELPLYETSLEMYNRGRVVIITRRK